MSQENVENARRAYATLNEAYRQGDVSVFRPILEEMWAPDVVFVPAGLLPDHKPRPHRGWEGVLHLIGNQLEAFSEGWVEADEFIDRGDYLVVPLRFGGRARHTGLPVEFSLVQSFTFRDGKVTRSEMHRTVAEALEAAGLSEQTMSQENVDIVRRAYELVNDGLKILPRELFDPEYEFDARDVAPSFGVIRGYEAVQAGLLEYWRTFEDFSLEFKEVVHADEERVVTAVRDGGRIKGSDAEIWNDLFHVWIFRDGKIIRVSSHNEKNRALEAAGLSE